MSSVYDDLSRHDSLPERRLHGFPKRQNEADGGEGPLSAGKLSHVSLLRRVGLRLHVNIQSPVLVIESELTAIFALLQHTREKGPSTLGQHLLELPSLFTARKWNQFLVWMKK